MPYITRFEHQFTIPEDEIYLDSATMGKMPVSSLDAMISYYREINSPAVRSMSQGVSKAKKILEKSRKTLKDFFHIQEAYVSFFPTREIALTNALFSLENMKNRKIITSILEEHSVLAPAIRTHNTFGTTLDYLTIQNEIDISNSIQEKFNTKGDIVLLSSVAVTNGVRRNWGEIVKTCKDLELLLFLDISQNIGHEIFDFSDKLPDLVISSGCIGALGPQGTSFQIASQKMYELMDPLFVGGGSVIALEEELYILEKSSTKFEPGIINIPAISALVNSLNVLSEIGLEKIKMYEDLLNSKLRRKLKDIANITLMEIEGAEYGPIVSFGSDKFEAHDVAMILEDRNKIIVRSGALCSHLFMYEQKYNDLVRISTHLYNTEEEIKLLLESLISILDN